MCVKRRSKSSTHNIVHAGIVRPVCEVKPLRCKPQRVPLAELEGAAQAQVESGVVWAQAAVAWSSGGTVISEMIVSIDVCPSQQIKGMTAVVRNNGGQLKASEELRMCPGAFQHRRDHELMPLIKI